jgi:asparagine synthase (glutamine-hydrolysing)
MCGIVGVISRKSLRKEDIAAVRAANQAIAHRGPDGAGEYLNDDSARGRQPTLFMAMRRLSIIDLAGGWQPLYNEDESLALIANGEIYNYVELRKHLEAKGHRYRTSSDCESVLHLYEEHGLAFVHRLRGMFAFALWDNRSRRLILGRDRMGEKPLYLYTEPDRIMFASEMKALLATGQIPFEIDADAVHTYMHYGWVPEPDTMVRNVRKLAAGHLMVIDLDSWHVREYPYWDLLSAAPVTGNPSDLIRAELDSIASILIRADVPVGIALSGGVDSSLIAALAAQRSGGPPLHTFSVGYAGRPGQDERDMARRLSHNLNLPFHEIEIGLGEMIAAFPALNTFRDDPIADIAGYSYLALSARAHAEGCPVLLQGHGGDELFWGYNWSVRAVHHSEHKARGKQIPILEELFAQLPRGLGKPHFIKAAYLFFGLLQGWRRLTPGSSSPADRLVLHDLTDTFQMAAHAVMSTYTAEFRRRVQLCDVGEFFDRRAGLHRGDIEILNLLCAGYLLENGLAQGDRLSMANSVEVRLPLVDYRLAELVVGLQKTTAAYDLAPKQWLRDAVKDLLPEEIFSRAKRGFNPPVKSWLASLRKHYSSDLCDGFLVSKGVLDRTAAERLCGSVWQLGCMNDLFVKYLSLEFWCRGMSDLAAKPAMREALDAPIDFSSSLKIATVSAT